MNRIHASTPVRALALPAVLCAALSLLPVDALAIASQNGNAERVVYDRIERAEANPYREEKREEVLRAQEEAAEAAEKLRSMPVAEIMRIPPSEAALAANAEEQTQDGPKESASSESLSTDARRFLLIGLGATLLLCISGALLFGGKGKKT